MSTEYTQIERLLEVRRIDEAEQLIGKLLGESPGDPNLCYYAARTALMQQDTEEGRRQVETALSSDPHHFGARFLLFHIESHANHYAQAEEIITGLIREYPEDPDLLAEYADIMIETLHLEKARLLADEALRLDPDNRSARLTDIMLSTIEGRRGRAGTQLSDLVREDPEAREVAFTLLQSLAEQNRSAEALELCQELMRSEPGTEGLIDLAVTLRSQAHWLALPLWPMRRFGWAASAAIWLGAVVGFRVLAKAESPWILAGLAAYLFWVLYTWLYTPIMTRWLRAKGI